MWCVCKSGRQLREAVARAVQEQRGVLRSLNLLLGALAREAHLSAKAVEQVRLGLPHDFEASLGSLVAQLRPGGNPISADELARFEALCKRANQTPPDLDSQEAFEFYNLALQVAEELKQSASIGALKDKAGKRIPPAEVQ